MNADDEREPDPGSPEAIAPNEKTDTAALVSTSRALSFTAATGGMEATFADEDDAERAFAHTASAGLPWRRSASRHRLGESLRISATTHFPDAADRIIRSEQAKLSLSASPSSTRLVQSATIPQPLHRSSLAPARSETPSESGVQDSFTSSSVSFAQTANSFTSPSPMANDHPAGSIVVAPTVAARGAQQPRSRSFFGQLWDQVGSSSATKSADANEEGSTPPPTAPPPASASARSFVELQRRNYRAKVAIVGDSGSGKSSFKHCFTNSVIKTLPDVAPSLSSSSTAYYYKSPTKRERLELQVFDAGPCPLVAGMSHLYEQTGMFVHIMNLTGVKQRTSKKFLAFGEGPSAIIHAQDRVLLELQLNKLASIERSCPSSGTSVTSRPPMLVVVGTHKDQLSDQSKDAVEAVLREVNQLVQDILRGLPNPLRLVGCFAVSCMDHNCVPENRGGPKTIMEMWNFLCEIILKDKSSSSSLQVPSHGGAQGGPVSASQAHNAPAAGPSSSASVSSSSSLEDPLAGEEPITANAIRRHMSFPVVGEVLDRLHADHCFYLDGDTQKLSLSIDRAPVEMLQRVTERVVSFIRRAKHEMNFVLVHLATLRHVAFSLGTFSSIHLDAALEFMARHGEILVLSAQPTHIGGREDSVVLWPHFAHRAAVTLVKYQQATWYPSGERTRLLPGIDMEECERADPKRSIARGILSPRLLVALSRSLPQGRKSMVERAETFTLLLMLNDILFQRPVCSGGGGAVDSVGGSDCQVLSASHEASDKDSVASEMVPPLHSPVKPKPRSNSAFGEGITVNNNNNSIVAGKPPSSSKLTQQQQQQQEEEQSFVGALRTVRYVAPALITQNAIPNFVDSVYDVASRGTLLTVDADPTSGSSCWVVCRSLHIQNSTYDFFHCLMCRLGPLIDPRSVLFRDAVWLARDEPSSHIRCLVRYGTSLAGVPSGGHPSTPSKSDKEAHRAIGGTVRFLFLSSMTTSPLAMSNFVAFTLSIAAELLRVRYPGMLWTISGEEHPRPASSEPVRRDFLLSDLDAVFEEAQE